MAYTETIQQLNAARRRILEIRAEMRELQAGIEPESVEDYAFETTDGPVRLSALFGHHDDLFVIHNMGASCAYCTLWADGFNGLLDHLEDRAAFVLSSPDSPEDQLRFAAGRGWRLRMVSHAGSTFATDMGYYSDAEDHPGFQPGVSVFRRDGDRIVRVADTSFGPNDDFCSIWHFWNLLPAGADGWAPQYKY